MVQFKTALTGLLALAVPSQTMGKGIRADSGRKLQNVCTEATPLDITMNDGLMNVLATIPKGDELMAGLTLYATEGVTIGSTTALLPEANDASVTGATVEDGMSGDTNFPHGNIKALATAGERSVCEGSQSMKIAGVPDGLGAYLADDDTVRIVVQNEGYGPLRYESFKYPANNGTVFFTGSHIQFVDYDREALSAFMSNEDPASSMVKGAGEMIEMVYNLKGELVGPRNGMSATAKGAHYGNTDANGTYTVLKVPAEADWNLQSFCSAHLEQKHQWGDGIGFEDDLFLTDEEWNNYVPDQPFVGISAHALDLHTKSLYAVGAFTMGGFEKIVEINPQNSDYVILGVSGYNGNFDIDDFPVKDESYVPHYIAETRSATYGPREDGNNYTFPKDIVPFRIYVGVKGKLEDGSDAPEDDFLARNGLKYGQLYGFAIDMRNTTDAVGPTAGLWRDEYHKTAKNGQMVPGKWIAQPWRWDGEVRNFEHDGSWDYQNSPPGTEEGSEMEGYFWWNSNGIDKGGCKTEHLTPDPRAETTAFIQGSTCGYFGHLYIDNVVATLEAAGGDLPATFDGRYYVYQGETDVTKQIELGGAGQLPDGKNATYNWDDPEGDGKATFEDVDGMEIFVSGDKLHLIIQEDSGNHYGERMFITSPLEHEDDGKDLTYYFIAMSGGKANTRVASGVGVPAGTACFDGEKYEVDAHEFSGVFDLSGLLRKDADGNFAMSAADTGVAKHENNALVDINDKDILIALQAQNLHCGIIGSFQADRGGQWLMYRPDIPVDDVSEIPDDDVTDVDEASDDAAAVSKADP